MGKYNLRKFNQRYLTLRINRFMFFLPERDFMGRRIIFYRPGVSDPMSPSCGYDILTVATLAYELIFDDEENQIRGCVHLADAKGIRMPHFTVFSPQYSFRVGKNTEVSWHLNASIYFKLIVRSQKILSLRHKGFHIVNVHKSLSYISDFILHQMGEKLKKRTRLYSGFDEFRAVDKKHGIDPAILPKEYGGTVPMREMIGKIDDSVKVIEIN